MSNRTRNVVKRRPDATRAALVAAAGHEFEAFGYDGTNSNRIAERAGFAPQTFYRHFADKAEIFRAVYARWVEEEQTLLDGVRNAAAAAEVAVRHHRASLNFRRALRQLSLSDPLMRAARAESRRVQMARLRVRLPHLADLPDGELAARLLIVERLTDACAENEFADLGIAAGEAKRMLADALAAGFGKRR